ncbi:MAG: hypothetical protein Q8K75_00180 [Chlamydiales bacterium]|nr:hypothetical protein [Chlamydiales bacterium]
MTNFAERLQYAAKMLDGREISKVRCSIGSNVFFGWGDDVIHKLSNDGTHHDSEWMVWLSFTDWRITHLGEYVLGVGDPHEIIKERLPLMIGKRLKSLEVISPLMDIEIAFDDGYKITTFIHSFEEDQWTLFFPDSTWLDVPFETEQQRQRVKKISKYFKFSTPFQKLDTVIDDMMIKKTFYDDERGFSLYFDKHLSLIIDMFAWRIVKGPDLYLDRLESLEELVQKLKALEGQELKRVETANDLADTRFIIGDEYILQTFACSKEEGHEWGIYRQDEPIFIGRAALSE